MGLEATIVCVDNSEWTRNGDFIPTRFESQKDAASMLCDAKLQANAESTVGLMCMAEKREVLVTLTTDMGKILSNLHKLRMGGEVDFVNSIQIAHLALKHRQSKNHKPRIIAFIGSPIADSDKELVNLGKKLKKNGIAVDIINFGEEEANTPKLEAFIEQVNKDDNSHLVTIPSGSATILTDAILSSAILGGEGGNQNLNEFGVDPNIDPELAMALRISMEEARQRQQADSGAAAAPAAAAPASQPVPMATNDDDEELRAAMAYSMQDQAASGAGNSSNAPAASAGAGAGASSAAAAPPPNFDSMTEEQQMEWALQMSMMGGSDKMDTSADAPAEAASAPAAGAGAAAGAAPAAAAAASADPHVLDDPAFLQSVLGTLPGVDPNDAQIQDILQSLQKKDDKTDDKKDDKKDDGSK